MLMARGEPVPILGIVRYCLAEGTAVEFSGGQEAARRTIRSYLEAKVISKYEERLSSTLHSPEKLAEPSSCGPIARTRISDTDSFSTRSAERKRP